MSVSHKKSALQCAGAEKRCNNKSARETNIETAFVNAKKQGWTKVVVTEKCTKYYCPACSHKLSVFKAITA